MQRADGTTVAINAQTAVKATQDGDGNNIVSTYATKTEMANMFKVTKVNYSGTVGDNGQVYIPLALVSGYTPVSVSAYVNSSSGGTLLFSAPVFGSNYCYTRCFSRNGSSTFNVTIHILHIKNDYVPS